jgi:hypothetical protein
MGIALLWVAGIMIAIGGSFVLWGNDAGSATEVALLNGTPVAHATDSECDAMYHAIWKVKQEPSHSTLIDIAKGLDCPFDE